MAIKIYLAGWSFNSLPNGITENWREEVIKKLSKFLPGAIFLDPSKRSMPEDDSKGIFGRDLYLIKNSNYILINGELPLGLGTSQEILIGRVFGVTPIFVCGIDGHYRKRNIKINNVLYQEWFHPFVPTTCLVVETLEEAVDVIKKGKKLPSLNESDFFEEAINYYLDRFKAKDLNMDI